MNNNPNSPEYRPLPDLDWGDYEMDGQAASERTLPMDAPVTDEQILAAIRAFLEAPPVGTDVTILIRDPDNDTDPGSWSTTSLTGYWYVEGQNPDGTPNIDIAITQEIEDSE